jgi:prepilin-type processing-associated H-X9-DG protein
MIEPDERERSTTTASVAPVPAVPVVDYSAPPPQNRNASRALLFGLLGFLPFLPAILAIRYGRRGLRDAQADPKIGGHSAARAGMILGIVSVAVWTVLSILAVPATMRARQQAMRVQCASQLRQMAMGAFMYATANRGFLPPDMDTLTKGGVPATLFVCPACAGDPTKPVASTGAFGNYNYVYVGNGRKLSQIRSAMSVPIMYELPTNHSDPGINVAYADGHVEMLSGPSVATFLAQVAATTQPATAPLSPLTTPIDPPQVEQ